MVGDFVSLLTDAENDFWMKLRLETHKEEGSLDGLGLEYIQY